MGTKNSKTAGDGVKTEVEKENDELLEAVESLPKVETLKSVKKPKGPKGRKPPSRTFLQTIVSYFQVKPETSNNKKDVKIVKKEPEVVLDLNVVEETAVLEDVRKGRPAPPGNRRRQARVRNTKPRETEDGKTSEVVEAIASEVTKKEKETKVFLKPPNRSESKWKAIGIMSVPSDDIKTPKDITAKDEDPLKEKNNNLEEKLEVDAPENLEVDAPENLEVAAPENLPSEASSQPPGKPPRPSLEKSEKKRSSNDFAQKKEIDTVSSIEKRTSKENKSKPVLPNSEKPKLKTSNGNGKDVKEEIETPNKNDFIRDLNKKLQIKPPPLLIKNESSQEEFTQNLETCSIEVEKNNTDISIKVTPTENEDHVHLSSDKENINESKSDTGKQKKKDKTKKKGIFHKIKKMNLEATKKFNWSFSKSFERKSTDSDICPIPQPLDENEPIVIKSEDDTKVDESRTVSLQSNPLYTENTDCDIKEEITENEPPNPKMYMKHVMKPNMLEELNIKLNKTKMSQEVQSPEPNFVSEQSQKPKPLLPQSPKPNKQEKVLAHPAPHSPVILKPIKRVAKEKRATSKTFSSENLNRFSEGKCDAEDSSPLSNLNNYNRSKTMNEEEILFKNREEIMIEKKLSLPNNVRKKSAHSIALDDAFNILDFELSIGEKTLENVQEEEDVVQIKTCEEKVPRGIRKKSCQSVALDNAFNILDFELEPLATVVDENTENEIENEDIKEAPLLRNGTIDLCSRDKSVLSIELESCLSILDGELDHVGQREELQKIDVNAEITDKIEEKIHDLQTIEGENPSKGNDVLLPEISNSELRSTIDDAKEEKQKSQNKEELGSSFDLGCEPSVDESKTDYL